jgi:hypothetical protein
MKQSQSQALTGADEERKELPGDDADIRELHGTPRVVGELPGESSTQVNQAMSYGRSSKMEENSTESKYLADED